MCGTERVKFRANSISVDGRKEYRDYCEPCFVSTFNDQSQAAEVLEQARNLREKDIQTKILRDLELLRTQFRPKLEELIAKNPRFTVASYEFIYAALSRAVNEIEPDEQSRGRHANAAELTRACEQQARQVWGDNARAHAKSLGFSSASDIRDIVFYLVDNGCLGRRKDDNRADFDGLPFL